MHTILLHNLEPHRFYPRPFGYSYYARPWELARDVWHEVASMIHRGVFGWDRTDTWSLDAHLAKILPQMLRYLADQDHGVPSWVFDAIGHPEYGTWFGNQADDSETESRVIGEEARRWWRQWLYDHAQAFEDWARLMEEGWTGSLYPKDYLETTFAAQVRDLGLEGAFDASDPVDALSYEEKEDAKRAWKANLTQVKLRMHDLIDHFESLWD